MSTDLKRQIGVRLRTYRDARGLTQEQLAAMINKTTETVSNIERGKTLPRLETLARISECLNTPLVNFFAQSSSKQSAKRIALEARLIASIQGMRDADVEIAVGQIELLAARRGS